MRLIEPDWPRNARVRACITTREGGVSPAPYDSLNLAGHVGDDPTNVSENRRRLRAHLGLTREPVWLEQVHGIRVLHIGGMTVPTPADAAWTDQPFTPCVIMSADCMPVLFADEDGSCVAAAHAGWRGLAAGVLEATISSLPVSPAKLTAWMGPAIGSAAFEVGPEVLDAFEKTMSTVGSAFVRQPSGRYRCDLYALARTRLAAVGVRRAHGGESCTYSDASRFFSYRRDGACGRMATLVWLS